MCLYDAISRRRLTQLVCQTCRNFMLAFLSPTFTSSVHSCITLQWFAVHIGLDWHISQLAADRRNTAVDEHALVHPAVTFHVWANLRSGVWPANLAILATNELFWYALQHSMQWFSNTMLWFKANSAMHAVV